MDMDVVFGTFEYKKFNENTWFITAMNGSLFMYLLEGTEKALLIDTAYGCGDLRRAIESLTDKKVIVANTHGHLDHVGGNGQWEEVYMHENSPIDHVTLKDGPCDVSKLPFPNYKKNLIKEGYVFHLGNRDVEVIDISAHSNGSIALLDKSCRMLFTGDEIESAQVLMYDLLPSGENSAFELKVKLHKENMEKLIRRYDEFDYIFPGHNGAPIDKSYIMDFLKLNESILNRQASPETELNHPYIEKSELGPRLRRVRYGKASFFVLDKDIAPYTI